MSSESALTEEQKMKALIKNLQNQSNDIKSGISEICGRINDLNFYIREKEAENQKSKSRRTLSLIILLFLFVFVFIRYYLIISSN